MLFSLMRSWQLVLLGLTTIALSLASGWTTWDGMSNFTQAPLLSFLITFGIQVIMLVTAWRIGEEFANRPRDPAAPPHQSAPRPILRMALTAALFAAAAALLQYLPQKLQTPLPTPAWTDAVLWNNDSTLLGTSGWASLALALALLFAAFAALRVLMALAISFHATVQFASKNVIVMCMFLACMATSVFFSFDSLFAIVFPQAERARAAELRALSRAGELVSGIAATHEKQRFSERRALLAGTEWRAYASNIENVSGGLKNATDALAKLASDATAEKTSKDLKLKQVLTRLEVERDQKQQDHEKLQATRDAKREKLMMLQAQAGRQEQELMQKREALAAKRTEAKAEEIGAGKSGQMGKGPAYNGIVREISLLNLAIGQAETQAKATAKDSAVLTNDIAQIEKQLNESFISLSGLNNRLAVENERSIGTNEAATPAAVMSRLGDERALLARRKEEFEKTPARDQLLALQSACSAAIGQLKDAGHLAPAGDVCDASRLQEAAAQLFVLDASAQALKTQCAPQPVNEGQHTGFDQSVQRARTCLEISGLPSSAAARILADIDHLERNRDDRAHRFVVTINAAQDGNRLAYLALALALGIDGLVFFAGVLGANAARSSLATLPRPWSFNIRRAEEGLRNALAPNALHTARATLRVARPLDAPRQQPADGAQSAATTAAAAHSVWSHVIDLQDPHLAIAHDVRRLINTAATIGAARRRPGTADAYELRAELIAFLNEIPLPDDDGPQTARDPLDHGGLIATSLAPDVHHGATIVVTYMTPSGDTAGYSSEMRLDKVPGEHEVLLRRFVNAASAAGGVIVVASENPDARLVLLHEQVCRVVVSLASPPRAPQQQAQPRQPAAAAPPAADVPPPMTSVTLAPTPAAARELGGVLPTAPPHASPGSSEPVRAAFGHDAQRASVTPMKEAMLPPQAVPQPEAAPIAMGRQPNPDHAREGTAATTQMRAPLQSRNVSTKPAAGPTAQTSKSATTSDEIDPQSGLMPYQVDVARTPAHEGERRPAMRISIQGDTISFSDAE